MRNEIKKVQSVVDRKIDETLNNPTYLYNSADLSKALRVIMGVMTLFCGQRGAPIKHKEINE
jgi:hypothetical protein